jgi:hypothetical protein
VAWKVRVGDTWQNTDDLTLDEVEAVEVASGVGWGLLNPLRSAPAAKALLAAFLVRDGVSDADARAQVGALRLKTAKHTFVYVEDDDLPDQWEDGLPVVDPKPETVEPSTG